MADSAMKMKGVATALDMQSLLFHTKTDRKQRDKFAKATMQKLDMLTDLILKKCHAA